jgi:hypothetical protein
MDEYFKKIMRHNGLPTLLLDNNYFEDKDVFTKELFYACKKVARSVDADLVVFASEQFNGASSFNPRFVALSSGVFVFSRTISLVVSDYLVNKEIPNISPKRNKDHKAFYDIFSDLDDSYITRKLDELTESELYKQTFQQMASLFVLFLIFHEAGHIFHRHGARHYGSGLDCDRMSESLVSSENEALDSQARELISDIFAYEQLISNQLVKVKEIIENERERYLAYISQYHIYLAVYFYFLSPKISEKNFTRSSHPPTAFRFQILLTMLLGNESLGLSRREKEETIAKFQYGLKDILENVFSDTAHVEWLFSIPESELKVWFRRVYERIPKWHIDGGL